MASVVPWNSMRLNTAPPQADSTLGDYDNWMWNLVVHEYTHILHLSQVRGVPRALNLAFGADLAPNQGVPRWLSEGLATWAESELTGSGRLNSNLFDMYLRAAVLDRGFPKLGTLSGAPVAWPQATAWYLYGGHFLGWIAERYGVDSIQAFIHAYGGHLVPFQLNKTARKTIGVGFVDEWPRFRASLHGQYVAEGLAARLQGVTPTEQLTDGGHRTRRVNVGPEGQVAWIRHDGVSHTTLVARGEGGERSIEVAGAGDFAFVDRERVAISLSHVVDRFFRYRDIFLVDLDGGEATPLTWGARARDLTVAPDGRTIVFSAVEAGRSDLWRLDLETGEVGRVFEAGPWGQAATPAWEPSGEAVVFAYAEPGEGRDLYRLDVATGDVSRLTDDRAVATDPWVDPDGRLVLFSSDRGGRFEVYVLRLVDGAVRRLVTVDTGAFSPSAVARAGGWDVYFTLYSGVGFDVARARFEAVDLFGAASPDAAGGAGEAPTLTYDGSPRSGLRRRAPIASLRPPTWTPLVGLSSVDQIVGVQLGTSDAPGANAAWMTAEWSFADQQPVVAGGWSNRRLPIGVDVSASRTLEERSRSLVVNEAHVPFVEEQIRAGGGFDVPFPRLEGRHVVAARWEFVLGRFLEEPALDVRPEGAPVVLPAFRRQDSVRLSWSWAHLDQYAWSISPERGTVVSVASRFRTPAIGSDVESGDVSVSWRQYAPMPWSRGHVVAARVAGGFGTANRRRNRLFSVGGLSPQDVFLAAWEFAPTGNTHVRGYEPGVRAGDRYYLANLEYRLPIAYLDAGASTNPLFFRALHAAVFVDSGGASSRRLVLADGLFGVGAELRLAMTFGYVNPASVRLGFARGLGGDGIFDAYMVYGWEF